MEVEEEPGQNQEPSETSKEHNKEQGQQETGCTIKLPERLNRPASIMPA